MSLPSKQKSNKYKNNITKLQYVNNSVILLKFINLLLKNGKKITIYKVLNNFFKLINKNQPKPLSFFQTAVKNIIPLFEISTRRYGRRTVQIPQPILNKKKQYSLGLKFLINAAKKNNEKKFHKALYKEFVNAFENKGSVKAQQQLLHRIAVENRSAVHFRW
jgi:small subunit ribosomal protein S7